MGFGDYRWGETTAPKGISIPEIEQWSWSTAEWHGMMRLYLHARRMLVEGKSLPRWIVEPLLRGPERTLKTALRLNEMLSLISALYLSASVPLLVEPPDSIIELEAADSFKIMWYVFLAASIFMDTVVISWSTFYNMAGYLCQALAVFPAVALEYAQGWAIAMVIVFPIFLIVYPNYIFYSSFDKAARGVKLSGTLERRLSIFLLEAYMKPVAIDSIRASRESAKFLRKVAKQDHELAHVLDETGFDDSDCETDEAKNIERSEAITPHDVSYTGVREFSQKD